MPNRILVVLALLGAGCAAALAAETPALNPEHPDRYTVQKGDTLWDIAGRFLQEPWQWPGLWRANPQIENPDLIYPGDVLTLKYVEGAPVVQLTRGGRPTVKLSPQVRELPLDREAVPTIPVDAIKQFLSRPRVVTEEEIESAPYVVSLGKEHLIGGAGSQIYVRGLDASGATHFTVYRRGREYRDPGAEGDELLGFEAVHIADAVLEKPGDPATLLLTSSKREVLSGDRLFASRDDEVQRNFMPRAPATEVHGSIISVVDGVTQIGQHQIVVLNRGRSDGLEPGHVLAVLQSGELVRDRFGGEQEQPFPDRSRDYPPAPRSTSAADNLGAAVVQSAQVVGATAKDFYDDTLGRGIRQGLEGTRGDEVVDPDAPNAVRLPSRPAGIVMVFRSFDRVSYALVMKATRAIHIEDIVTNP